MISSDGDEISVAMSFVMVTFTTTQQLLKFFMLMLIITVKHICFHILEVLFCDSPLILFYWTASVSRPLQQRRYVDSEHYDRPRVRGSRRPTEPNIRQRNDN